MMRVSVCVATKNRTDMLHQLLWSLIRQSFTAWDLVIVDDSDEPVRWSNLGVYPRLFNEMSRTGRDIRIAPGPRASRVGAAYQVGFRAAKKENELFLRADDDAWLEPDYLARLVNLMEDRDVGACGGLFLHPGQDIETLSRDDRRYALSLIDGLSDFGNIQWYRHELDDLIPVEHLTANILFSREWLEKIDGFETRLYRQHRDETQVSWRLYVEGARLLVDPGAVAWHLRGVTGGARGHSPDVYLEDHRKFMAQRRTMKPGIHICLGHGIGDGFMATPMMHVLKRMNPDRNLAVYAPWASAVLEGNPDVDEVAAHLLDAQRTVRLEQSVYTWASANGWKGHLTEAYCRMFDLPAPEDPCPRIFWPAGSERDCVSSELPATPYVVIAPWSTAKTFDLYGPSGNKNWPIDRWPQVVAWAKQNGLEVVQLRGSEDEPLVEGVDVDFCNKPLRETFACIAGAALLVSVDTMAHHAAAALGVPSVVLWGRSKPEHFGYVRADIVNLRGECPGLETQRQESEGHRADLSVGRVVRERPCVGGDQWAMDREICPIQGHPCMSGIAVETVIAAMKSLLADTIPIGDAMAQQTAA
jgi:ADP-heptose:LPS heptosyltransferase